MSELFAGVRIHPARINYYSSCFICIFFYPKLSTRNLLVSYSGRGCAIENLIFNIATIENVPCKFILSYISIRRALSVLFICIFFYPKLSTRNLLVSYSGRGCAIENLIFNIATIENVPCKFILSYISVRRALSVLSNCVPR